jgi:hypothetical protein
MTFGMGDSFQHFSLYVDESITDSSQPASGKRPHASDGRDGGTQPPGSATALLRQLIQRLLVYELTQTTIGRSGLPVGMGNVVPSVLVST